MQHHFIARLDLVVLWNAYGGREASTFVPVKQVLLYKALDHFIARLVLVVLWNMRLR